MICTKFPEKSIAVKGLKTSGKVTMLGFDGKISWKKSGNIITLSMPDLTPLTNPGPYAWVFKIENVL